MGRAFVASLLATPSAARQRSSGYLDVGPGRHGETLKRRLRCAADALLRKTAAMLAHTFLNVKGTTLAGGGSGINPNWILLDS